MLFSPNMHCAVCARWPSVSHIARGIIPSGARDVVPIAGMIIGNSMNVASPRQCTEDIIRRSVRLAMVSVIDGTKTMGIVFLPGAMTGMILAGAGALQAVRPHVVVFMLLSAVSLTATIVSRPPPYAERGGRPFGRPPPGRSRSLWAATRSGQKDRTACTPCRSPLTSVLWWPLAKLWSHALTGESSDELQ